MTLSFIKLPLVLLTSIIVTTLAGCQSHSNSSSQRITATDTVASQNNSRLTGETAVKKSLPTQTDLAITNELLEKYEWQLVSAMSRAYDDNRQLTKAPIGDFYHPDYPVSVSFSSHLDSQTIHFSSNCNGSGASYTLSKDNTLRVADIVSTDMGCTQTGNRIENTLFALMQDSSSKLTLSLQPLKSLATLNPQNSSPRYHLLQTMESGETLLWQNQEKESRQ